MKGSWKLQEKIQ